MGFLSRFEGRMEDTVEGAAERMGGSSLSPAQIAKKAEKQMRREKIVGAGKQYAPTLYTVLVSTEDDSRLFGYYATLAGETETFLTGKAGELGLVMDGRPLVRFIADPELKRGKFDVVAEMVASSIIENLRADEMARYGLAEARGVRGARGARSYQGGAPAPRGRSFVPPESSYQFDDYDEAGFDPGDVDDSFVDAAYAQSAAPYASGIENAPSTESDLEVYLYDEAHDTAYQLTGDPQRIGRESTNEIQIPDINASRTHAEIHMEPTGAWVITDLNSTNGLFINGRKVKSAPLRDADMITIGTTELEFQLLM